LRFTSTAGTRSALNNQTLTIHPTTVLVELDKPCVYQKSRAALATFNHHSFDHLAILANADDSDTPLGY